MIIDKNFFFTHVFFCSEARFYNETVSNSGNFGVEFKWVSRSEGVTTTCCWTIVEPKLVTVGSQEPAEDVELCYKSQAYLYNGKLWACTIPGENGTNESFISNRYLKNNNNNSQCTNSSVELLSELPCFSSTSSSTISGTSSSNQLSSSSNIGPVTDGTLSISQLTTLGVVTSSTIGTSSSILLFTSFSTVKPTTIDTLSTLLLSESISSVSTMTVTSTSDISSSTSLTSTNLVTSTTIQTSISTSLTSSIKITSTSGISNSILLTLTDKDATTRSSVTPAPSINFSLTCPEDGPWIQTLAGTNATRARGCFKGTVSGQLYIIKM